VHRDMCGPVTPTTPEGRRYFLLLIDDLSRYMWVVILASKGVAANAIKRAQAAAEAECGRKLGVLRTDNGMNSRRLNSRRTARMRVFSVTTPRHTARSRTASSSGADSCGDGSGPPQAEGNACCLLGRGGGDGCLHP
jgi:hypothetical protein